MARQIPVPGTRPDKSAEALLRTTADCAFLVATCERCRGEMASLGQADDLGQPSELIRAAAYRRFMSLSYRHTAHPGTDAGAQTPGEPG